MTTNNHPANGPVSLARLHQISEILSKAAAQSDGGNLGYAMADAVKVIDGTIAAFGAEPVAYADPQAFDNFKSNSGKNAACTKEWMWRDPSNGLIPLYIAPPATVVPEIDRNAIADRVYGKCCCIPGATFYNAAEFAIDEVEACRAAMLQAGNHTEQCLDMVDRYGDTNKKGRDGALINECAIPGTRFQQVADLYGITSPTGSETSFTFDAFEASNFAKGGWSVQEYIELERYQKAIVGNSPATQDGYALVPKELTCAMDDAAWEAYHETRCMSDIWAALLAAAQQQEG